MNKTFDAELHEFAKAHKLYPLGLSLFLKDRGLKIVGYRRPRIGDTVISTRGAVVVVSDDSRTVVSQTIKHLIVESLIAATPESASVTASYHEFVEAPKQLAWRVAITYLRRVTQPPGVYEADTQYPPLRCVNCGFTQSDLATTAVYQQVVDLALVNTWRARWRLEPIKGGLTKNQAVSQIMQAGFWPEEDEYVPSDAILSIKILS